MAEEKRQSSDALLHGAAAVGALIGALFFFYGLYLLFASDKALPFIFALIIGGAVNALVCYLAAIQRSRVAWSFALSLNGVGAIVFLFGAPKVRDGWDVHITVALLPTLAFGLVAVLMALSADLFE